MKMQNIFCVSIIGIFLWVSLVSVFVCISCLLFCFLLHISDCIILFNVIFINFLYFISYYSFAMQAYFNAFSVICTVRVLIVLI